MPFRPKLVAADYYESLPAPGFRSGDIWHDLPMLGLHGIQHGTGLVITAACDLANRKTETITYLPIVPVADYLNGPASIPLVVKAIQGQAEAGRVSLGSADLSKGYELPPRHALEQDYAFLQEAIAKLPQDAKVRHSLDRAAAGIQMLVDIWGGKPSSDLKLLKKLVGEKELVRVTEAIARNGYSTDVHFLPADGKKSPLSSVSTHSVALFRYPVTVPCTLLELAEDPNQIDWVSALESKQVPFPFSPHLQGKKPIRVSTVKARFYSDILARFVALTVRLGSPDFSADSISQFSEEIRECR